MDPRLPYALGALAGMVRADAANEAASGSPDGTVSDAMRSALTVADQLRRGPGGVHAIRSGQWSVPAGSARDRLLCAVPIGIAMSTIDRVDRLQVYKSKRVSVCGAARRSGVPAY